MRAELKQSGRWSYYYVPHLEGLGLVHGFMTRSSLSILSSSADREDFRNTLSLRDVIVMRQEHGTMVHTVHAGERPTVGDGLLLFEAGVAGVIKTADCIPVILFDPALPGTAIVHAGWRGTVGSIGLEALRLMAAEGSRPQDVHAVIGPGIGACCYNVGEEVEARFKAAGFPASIFSRRGSQLFLDLVEANRWMLAAAGVREITSIGLCTACSKDLFYSARKEGTDGRQVNFTGLRPAETDGVSGKVA